MRCPSVELEHFYDFRPGQYPGRQEKGNNTYHCSTYIDQDEIGEFELYRNVFNVLGFNRKADESEFSLEEAKAITCEVSPGKPGEEEVYTLENKDAAKGGIPHSG